MKKSLVLPLLLIALAGSSQSLCLQTFCKAWNTQVGDTAQIEGILTTSKGFRHITFSQTSGPNTAVITMLNPSVTSDQLQGTQLANVTGMAVGTYVFTVTAQDVTGGTVAGQDSIIVTPATVVTTQRTVTGITITLFGVTVTIPAGQGTKVTFSDSSTQSY